jgi:hypothetical protein
MGVEEEGAGQGLVGAADTDQEMVGSLARETSEARSDNKECWIY